MFTSRQRVVDTRPEHGVGHGLARCDPVSAPEGFLPGASLRECGADLVALFRRILVGHYTDARPWRVGATVMVLGLSMVFFVAVALGGLKLNGSKPI